MALGDKSRSEAGLDPTQYQVLLIMEERMNEKLEKQYDKMVKEVKSAVEPIKEQLTGMEKRIDRRFDEGNAKFREHEERLGDHSDQIEANSRVLQEAKALMEQRHKDCPLDGKKDTGALTKKEKKEPLFTRKDLLTLILTVLSPIFTLWVLVQIKLIAFTDTSSNNPVVQPAPASTGTPP